MSGSQDRNSEDENFTLQKREAAGSNATPVMSTRTVQNALRCCLPPPEPVELPPEEEKDECPPANAIASPLGGVCDIDFQFRADVHCVEKFIPRAPPEYPPMNPPINDTECGYGTDSETEPFLVEKGSGLPPPTQYTPCFESWVKQGYQRER